MSVDVQQPGAAVPPSACGRPGDRAISGRTCTIHDDTGCAVKVAVGAAAASAARVGAPNAGALRQMAGRLGRDDTVCLSDVQRELATWAAAVRESPQATRRDREWARDVTEALNLGGQ